jgi:hypothetical protein
LRFAIDAIRAPPRPDRRLPVRPGAISLWLRQPVLIVYIVIGIVARPAMP